MVIMYYIRIGFAINRYEVRINSVSSPYQVRLNKLINTHFKQQAKWQ